MSVSFLEAKRHGSPAFPMQYYYVDKTHPRYVMNTHWHNEFEIIRVLEGSFHVFLNNVEYPLSKGDVLFVGCGCLHRGEPYDSVYECVVFDVNMLCRGRIDAATKLITPIINSSVETVRLLNKDYGHIHQTLSSLFEVLREEAPYYELETYSLLFKLFSQLYSQKTLISPSNSQHSYKTDAVIKVLGWIEENFSEPITLDMLSEISGLNKKYLCRVFKEYTSKTIFDHINELRIENACYEMSTQKESITRAAFDSGFNDLSYFCKIFKKYKGITPREYKKSQ